MSVAKVLKLEEYRDRRQHRLRLARALFEADPGRRDVLHHLAEIAAVSGADRVAAVWVDEYGPGLVHPFVVLDLLSDRPRRRFQVEPLQLAWEIGVPGAHDEVVAPGATGSSTFAIALGSDGARAWFVVADSVSVRAPLDAPARNRLMFLAGECSAVALHRDLDADDGREGSSTEGRFAGWPILRDLEGREDDEAEGRRIAQRFVVARLLRMLADRDLTMPEERVRELAEGARRELGHDSGMASSEKRLWVELLDAFEGGVPETIASLAVQLGEAAEDRGHEHGAEELYRCGYAVAAAIGRAHTAIDAARFLGRLRRRRAAHDESATWYSTAHGIASAAGIDHLAAVSLAGLANLKRERGNLPAARETLVEALELANRSGHAETIVGVHRAMLGLEQAAGNVDSALNHGWLAVGASVCDRERTRCLASLAGTLERAGDYGSATDAWSVVAATTSELYLKVFALDALSHISALLGDEEGFERYASRCDELDYGSLHSACSQILHYRGLSYRALGRYAEAEEWLGRAVSYAEQHGFSEILFRAEEDLRGLHTHVSERARPAPAAPPAIREGVRAMRRELAGAAP